MGELNQHDLNIFNCNVFIETGTGRGIGTFHATTFECFKKIHTIEVMPSLYDRAKKAIKDKRVSFHLGKSIDVLNKLLPSIDKNDKILFWLDAHFPGADYQLAPYKFEKEDMPLDIELQTIINNRSIKNDSFIIDDLNLYEYGPFQLGNSNIPIPRLGIGFIEDIFNKTHVIKKDYRHQGFLIITPNR